MSHDNTVDKVAMLLSTDWFQPYWETMGLNATLETRRCIQQGCREIVNQMMGDAKEYWLISFAEERMRGTREAMSSLAGTCGLDIAPAERLSRLCIERATRDERQKTAWLLGTVTEELLADNALTSEVKIILERAHTNLQSNEDFKMLSKPQSSWDRRIRALTPDLPTYLTDWISAGVLAEATLHYILTCLSTEQQQLLRARFKVAAMRLTGLTAAELPDSWR